MICAACCDGGTANAEANRLSDQKLAAMLRAEAIKMHGKCDGRCDCHHMTGDGLMNPERRHNDEAA